MKSIYDEAIENAKCYKVVNEIFLDGKDRYRHDNYANQIIQTLERAKKEHELLEMYRDFHYGNHDAETDHDILRQIKAHEEELK
jgi:hypothetical protein